MPSKQTKPKGLRRELLIDVLRRAKIDPSKVDYLIVSDGSGAGWKMACGWASVMINMLTKERKTFHGACSPGSVGMGEIMGPLHALTWCHAHGVTGKRIAVLSDSQYVVNTGNLERKVTVKANFHLWSQFDWLKRQGYRIEWVWMRRDECALNKYADQLSRLARLKLTESDLAADCEVLPTGERIEIHRRNPH